jgi:hypothetical protein
MALPEETRQKARRRLASIVIVHLERREVRDEKP